ncbi:hypothetical protein LBMAG18_09640 [Alphaproteobacteria bacterium]|nr:hypothetical protein LBMAG18_09640 [Alphaproteobacteria bacterium]
MFKEKNTTANKEDKKIKSKSKAKNKDIVKQVKNNDKSITSFSYRSALNKLTKSFALILILTVIVVMYFSFVRYKILLERVDNEVEISANQVENVFIDYANISEMLLMHLNHKMLENDAFKLNSKITQVLSTFNDDAKVINSLGNNFIAGGMFYWIDSKKNLIASSNGLVSRVINLSNRDYLSKTEKLLLKVQVGSPVIGALSGQSIIPMAIGVKNNQDNFAGTIVLSLKLENFLNRFRNLKERNVEFAILDENNKLIMSSSDDFFRKNQEIYSNISVSENGMILQNFSLFSLNSNVIYAKAINNQPYKIISAMRGKNAYKIISREMLPNLIELILIVLFLITTKISYRLIVFNKK